MDGSCKSPYSSWWRKIQDMWVDEEQKRDITSIYREISEVKFPGSKLDFADDGAPWFGQWEQMPEGWDWNRFWSYFHAKYVMMKWKCNRWWEMVDSEMGIACEVYYRFCDPNHHDFLGLPVVTTNHTPLSLSIGKARHGQQMRTGWPPHPKSLADREQDDLKRNLYVETWFSNALKFDYPTHQYPQLRDIAEQMEAPPNRYARETTTQAPIDPTTTSASLEGFEEFDTAEVALGRESLESGDMADIDVPEEASDEVTAPPERDSVLTTIWARIEALQSGSLDLGFDSTTNLQEQYEVLAKLRSQAQQAETKMESLLNDAEAAVAPRETQGEEDGKDGEDDDEMLDREDDDEMLV